MSPSICYVLRAIFSKYTSVSILWSNFHECSEQMGLNTEPLCIKSLSRGVCDNLHVRLWSEGEGGGPPKKAIWVNFILHKNIQQSIRMVPRGKVHIFWEGKKILRNLQNIWTLINIQICTYIAHAHLWSQSHTNYHQCSLTHNISGL